MNWLERIKSCLKSERVLYSGHARKEMRFEEFGQITEQEVYEAILSAEVIEEYPDDKPYPSCLLFGRTRNNRPLHIVIAYDAMEMQVIIVTVYQPIPEKWEDYRRRK